MEAGVVRGAGDYSNTRSNGCIKAAAWRVCRKYGVEIRNLTGVHCALITCPGCFAARARGF